MSNVVIHANRLSKRYEIGAVRENTLRGQVAAGFQKLGRRDKIHGESPTTLWALKDVSFEVEKGEVLGIIGKNGSGKSTLLKILSRVTRPTTGWVGIKGQIGSLLEVGTGFNPDLTGRENIYLNGAILGLRRQEIDRKFDEIVAFSEIEQFLYTPVKHYSSGMYVRLAFSVAIHLSADILMIDEVLGVGDAAFRQKSAARIQQIVKDEGRTIMLVSHDPGSIRSLCTKCLYLKAGALEGEGLPDSVVDDYLTDSIGATPGSNQATKVEPRHAKI